MFGLRAGAANGHEEIVLLLFKANPGRAGYVGLDFMSKTALFVPILEARQTVSVQRGIGISGIRIQALADHQAGFPVGIPSGFRKTDIRRNDYVPGHSLPDKLESVSLCPHVFSPP